jgi:putative redox protein
MVQAKVNLTSGGTRQFIMETGSGNHLIIDDSIGKTGPTPVELVAGALAGCTALDVITILRSKKHKNVTAYEVSVEAEQLPSPPKVFTDMRVHHKITGSDVDPGSVEDAIELSEEKYCAVGAMLRQSGAEIKTTYSIYDTAGNLVASTRREEPVAA